MHRHRWSLWTEPKSEFAEVIDAIGNRSFKAKSMPSGWYQQRTCSKCNRIERRTL